jgi:predicted ATP-binding protein involved in virulence
MSISKKEGFIFKTLDENQLSPTNLSSGEQHELVLLYELLFKVAPNSLILIDEPELSLHVGWQQQFLNDLQEITKLVEFDVLIATHSPLIINERWDLTVDLKGPKNEKVPNS